MDSGEEQNSNVWMALFSYAALHLKLLLCKLTHLGDFDEPNFYFLH